MTPTLAPHVRRLRLVRAVQLRRRGRLTRCPRRRPVVTNLLTSQAPAVRHGDEKYGHDLPVRSSRVISVALLMAALTTGACGTAGGSANQQVDLVALGCDNYSPAELASVTQGRQLTFTPEWSSPAPTQLDESAVVSCDWLVADAAASDGTVSISGDKHMRVETLCGPQIEPMVGPIFEMQSEPVTGSIPGLRQGRTDGGDLEEELSVLVGGCIHLVSGLDDVPGSAAALMEISYAKATS